MSTVRTAPNRPGKSHDLSDSTLWLAAFSLWFVFAPLDFAGKKLRNGAVVWSDENCCIPTSVQLVEQCGGRLH